jgi:hypothetical protein
MIRLTRIERNRSTGVDGYRSIVRQNRIAESKSQSLHPSLQALVFRSRSVNLYPTFTESENRLGFSSERFPFIVKDLMRIDTRPKRPEA